MARILIIAVADTAAHGGAFLGRQSLKRTVERCAQRETGIFNQRRKNGAQRPRCGGITGAGAQRHQRAQMFADTAIDHCFDPQLQRGHDIRVELGERRLQLDLW